MMRKISRYRRAAFWSSGFNLVEAIIVLVVLAIASVTIATLTGNIFNSQGSNKDLQVGLQLMQECAEQVLARNRDRVSNPSGFTAPDCPSLATSGMTVADIGFSGPTVLSGATPPGVCPSGATCKLVTVSVSGATIGNLTPITLLLVE